MTDTPEAFDFYKIPEDPNHADEGIEFCKGVEYWIPFEERENGFVKVLSEPIVDSLWKKLIAKYNGFNPETAPDGEHEVLCGAAKNPSQLPKLKVFVANGEVKKVNCFSFSEADKKCFAGRAKECLHCEKFNVAELEGDNLRPE